MHLSIKGRHSGNFFNGLLPSGNLPRGFIGCIWLYQCSLAKAAKYHRPNGYHFGVHTHFTGYRPVWWSPAATRISPSAQHQFRNGTAWYHAQLFAICRFDECRSDAIEVFAAADHCICQRRSTNFYRPCRSQQLLSICLLRLIGAFTALLTIRCVNFTDGSGCRLRLGAQSWCPEKARSKNCRWIFIQWRRWCCCLCNITRS